MSTVSVTNVKNASSSVNNAVTTSGGDLTNAAGVSFMGGSKNLLYNGAMQVAQRGTSTASISSATYGAADRWAVQSPGTINGSWTQSVENDAPTGSGLRKSTKMLIPTAANPTAGQGVQLAQALEGQDLQRVAKGTASAQQLTLSFWVKSNLTGTFITELYDIDNTRSVSAAYTISASATWEKKTVTFPADTTGAWDNDNAASLSVVFWLSAGSNFTSGTLNTSWASVTSANRAVGQTNLAANNNNYWQVTGVQLEVGPVATSFEFKSYAQELRECQRYYWRQAPGTAYGLLAQVVSPSSTTAMNVVVPFQVVMRATPTVFDVGNALRTIQYDASGTLVVGSVSTATLSTDSTRFNGVITLGGTGFTRGYPGWLSANNDTAAYIGFGAEL